MKKNRAIEAIQEMPAEFELDELIEKLIFLEKIEKGLQQLEDGNTISHDEVKKKVKSWRK